jgi:hypothetical protein
MIVEARSQAMDRSDEGPFSSADHTEPDSSRVPVVGPSLN